MTLGKISIHALSHEAIQTSFSFLSVIHQARNGKKIWVKLEWGWKEKEKDSIVIAKECWEERERREKEKRKAYARGRVLVRWGELVGGSMAKPMEITLTLFQSNLQL